MTQAPRQGSSHQTCSNSGSPESTSWPMPYDPYACGSTSKSRSALSETEPWWFDLVWTFTLIAAVCWSAYITPGAIGLMFAWGFMGLWITAYYFTCLFRLEKDHWSDIPGEVL
jgi:hypothetical protein